MVESGCVLKTESSGEGGSYCFTTPEDRIQYLSGQSKWPTPYIEASTRRTWEEK